MSAQFTKDEIIIYSYDQIEEIANSFKAVLDEETINKLLEIKKNNKFITRKTPLRLKYQVQQSVATLWRKEREEKNLSAKEKFESVLISNLNKLSTKNYSTISDECFKAYYIAKEEFINEKLGKTQETVSDNWEEGEDIDTMEITNLFVNTIFSKAMSEQNFADLYAKLLQDIATKKILGQSDFKLKVVEMCDEFYSKNIDELLQEVSTDIPYDKLCELFASKTKFVGGFVLISNLYKYDLLKYDTIKKYFNGLMEYTKHSPQEYIEKYLDTLISIINNCGMELDKAYPDKFKNDFMGPVYELKDNKNQIKQKFKFKLLDLIELYENNWVSDTEWTLQRKKK